MLNQGVWHITSEDAYSNILTCGFIKPSGPNRVRHMASVNGWVSLLCLDEQFGQTPTPEQRDNQEINFRSFMNSLSDKIVGLELDVTGLCLEGPLTSGHDPRYVREDLDGVRFMPKSIPYFEVWAKAPIPASMIIRVVHWLKVAPHEWRLAQD